MERIYAFFPSVLIIACIAGVTRLYVKWIIKRFGDNFKSVQWHKENKWKVIWTVGNPRAYVWTPAVNELIFRAPLIIAFSAMSSVAWYGVFASSGLFALMHLFENKIWMPDILSARKNGHQKSDDVVAEMTRLHHALGTETVGLKVGRVTFSFLAGILFGYYGITYQSIWVSVGLHSAWNFLIPMVLPPLVVLVVIACIGFVSLLDKAMSRWKRRSRLRWKGV